MVLGCQGNNQVAIQEESHWTQYNNELKSHLNTKGLDIIIVTHCTGYGTSLYVHTHPNSTESGKEKLFRNRINEGDTHTMLQTQRQLPKYMKNNFGNEIQLVYDNIQLPYSAKFLWIFIFKRSRKYFNEKFSTRDTVFTLCIDDQYPVAKLPNLQETLSKETPSK